MKTGADLHDLVRKWCEYGLSTAAHGRMVELAKWWAKVQGVPSWEALLDDLVWDYLTERDAQGVG